MNPTKTKVKVSRRRHTSDVHSGTVEEGKDQIRQFCEEQRGTIGYYLSTLEEEERNAVVASMH